MDTFERPNHLDFLQIYKDTLTKLSVDEEMIDFNYDINLPLMESFLHGKPIPMIERKEPYLSSFMLHDFAQDLYLPVLFCKVKYQDNTVQLANDLPIVNRAVKQLLAACDIQINDKVDQEKIPLIFNDLQNALSRKQVFDKYELVPAFTYHFEEILQYNGTYTFLYDYLFGDATDKKYDSLFKEVRDKEFESQIMNDSFGFFAREERVQKRMDYYLGTKVNITDPNLRADFLVTLLRAFLKKKEKTLIVVSSNMKQRILKLLKSNKMDSFCLDFSSFSTEDILPDLEKVSYTELDLETKNKCRRHKEAQERMIRFESKQKECYEPLKQYFTIDNLSLICESLDRDVLDMDLRSYDAKQFETDCHFLNVLDELPSVKNSCIIDHPYYGLTISNTRENFSRLQLLTVNLITKLKEFKSAVDSLYEEGNYYRNITNLNEYDVYVQAMQLILQYNGFPRKYFKLVLSGEQNTDLKELKNAYQAVSSSRLVLRSLCSEEIFSLDLRKLIHNYRHNIFKRFSIRRKLTSYLVSKKKGQYDLLLNLIQTYLDSQEHLEKLLPKYREIYGENVNTMNGVVEIESNIEYINRFGDFANIDADFCFDNPFVKRLIKDKDFRVKATLKEAEVSNIFKDVNELLNQYLGYFRGITLAVLKSENLDDIIEQLSNETYLDYSFFDEYLRFVDVKEEASPLLQVILNRYIKNQEKISSFKEDFIHSIIYHVFIQCDKEFAKYQKDYDNVRFKYLETLSDKKMLDDLEQKDLISSSIHEFLSQKENAELYTQLSEELKTNNLKDKTLEKAMDILSVCYPCSIVEEAKLYRIPDDLFDNVIVFGGENYSSQGLLSSYRVGKKILFVYNKYSDKRVLGYHETTISKDNLYYRVFNYQSLPDNLLQLMKAECDKQGLKLEVEGIDYPLVINDDEKTYGILPNVLITSEMDVESIGELMNYLYEFPNVYLIYFNVYRFLLGKDNQLGFKKNKNGD